jgi:hypothetical protein
MSAIPASLLPNLTGTPYADIEELNGFFFWSRVVTYLDAKDREALRMQSKTTAKNESLQNWMPAWVQVEGDSTLVHMLAAFRRFREKEPERTFEIRITDAEMHATGFKKWNGSDGEVGVGRFNALHMKGENLREDCWDGLRITMPEVHAVYGPKGLTSVAVSEGVKSLPRFAFQYCTSLTSVTLPESLETIKGGAFQYCTSLASLVFPGSLKTIKRAACVLCTSLTSVTLPDSLTTLEFNAFKGCSSLASVVLSNSLKSIDKGAFLECTSLASVSLPDSLWYIDGKAFYQCRSLTSVALPDSLELIGPSAFAECCSLVSMVFPKSLRFICERAFAKCSNLASVTLPDSLEFIKPQAFAETHLSEDDIIFAGFPKTSTYWNWSGLDQGMTHISIPDGVTTIAADAFDGYASLVSVTLPNSLKIIERGAFRGCTRLTSVAFPDSLETIGTEAFAYCVKLASVSFPDSLDNVEEFAFTWCDSLKNVVIPASLLDENIGEGAFPDEPTRRFSMREKVDVPDEKTPEQMALCDLGACNLQ